MSDTATHTSVTKMIRAVLGRGDEPIGGTLDPTTRELQPRSVLTVERTGVRFKIEVTELPGRETTP